MKSLVGSFLRIFCFGIVFLLCVCAVDSLTGASVYASRQNHVWDKLQNGDHINILVMGNSHAYASLDTEVLSKAYNLEVDTLGSGSQNMIQTLAALKVVLKYDIPDCIVLETFSACSDSQNALETDKRGMLYQNLDGIDNYLYKLQGVVHTFSPKNIADGTFQIFRTTDMWNRWNIKGRIVDDTHGCHRLESYGYGEYDASLFDSATEKSYSSTEPKALTTYNEAALKEFLRLTDSKGIKVVLFKAPTLNSTDVTGQMKYISSLAEEYDNVILNMDLRLNEADMNLQSGDFYDTGHLSRTGMEKCTSYFGKILADLLGLEWNHETVFAYKSESVQERDKRYVYTIENWAEDSLYEFLLYVDDELVDVQKYSAENTYISDYDARQLENVRIVARMIPPADEELGESSPDRVSVTFMKQNECNIEE